MIEGGQELGRTNTLKKVWYFPDKTKYQTKPNRKRDMGVKSGEKAALMSGEVPLLLGKWRW